MMRKYHVRICEGLRGRFPGSTRFIITGNNKELLENRVKPLIEAFLKERGLELSKEKTKITHTEEGFDFLGQNVRRYRLRNGGSKLLIKPSENSIHNFLTKIRATIKKMPTAKQENLIRKLNPMISGWANYHRHVVSKEVFDKVDYEIWIALWRWAKRRHPNKGRQWISQKYFHRVKGIKRAFSCTIFDDQGNKQPLVLFRAPIIPIIRHIQILPAANPFDPEWDAYFEQRLSNKMHHNQQGRETLKHLRVYQKGLCPQCSKPLALTGRKGIVHYLKGRLEGGEPNFYNLILLHPDCHAERHKTVPGS